MKLQRKLVEGKLIGMKLGRHWTWDQEHEEEDIYFAIAFSDAVLASFEFSFVSLHSLYLLKALG